MTNTEPVVTSGSVLAVLQAGFGVLVAFGVPITVPATLAINGFVIALMTFWARTKTVTAAKHMTFLEAALELPQDSTIEDVERKVGQ